MLSSSTVFMFSIQMASTGPSSTSHLHHGARGLGSASQLRHPLQVQDEQGDEGRRKHDGRTAGSCTRGQAFRPLCLRLEAACRMQQARVGEEAAQAEEAVTHLRAGEGSEAHLRNMTASTPSLHSWLTGSNCAMRLGHSSKGFGGRGCHVPVLGKCTAWRWRHGADPGPNPHLAVELAHGDGLGVDDVVHRLLLPLLAPLVHERQRRRQHPASGKAKKRHGRPHACGRKARLSMRQA